LLSNGQQRTKKDETEKMSKSCYIAGLMIQPTDDGGGRLVVVVVVVVVEVVVVVGLKKN